MTDYVLNVEYMRQQIKACGWKQTHLAQALGVSVETLYKWSNGKAQPRPHFQVALIRHLKADGDKLFQPRKGSLKSF